MPQNSIPAFPDEAPAADSIPAFPDEGGAPTARPSKARISIPPYERGGLPKDLKTRAQDYVRGVGSTALSLADLVGSIPAGVVGTAEDIGMRAYGAAKGMSHKEASQLGNLGFQVAMEKYGNPFSKLLAHVGLGKPEGKGVANPVDALMSRANEWLGKGGEWVEEHTGGAINKEDAESLVNWLMAIGGAKGVAGGVAKMAKAHTDAVIAGLKSGPKGEEAQQQQALQQTDPPQAAQALRSQYDAALEAHEARARLTSPTNLVFDPKTGTLAEAAPEPGRELPKPSTRDRALEKVASGRAFDMTAEERIAYRGLEPVKPIVDEQGNVIDKAKFAETRHGALRGQEGSVDPKMLARLAALGVGAWAGLYFSDSKDLEHAFAGGALGFGLASLKPKAAAAAWRKWSGADTRLDVRDLANGLDEANHLNTAETWATQRRMEDLGIPKAREEELGRIIRRHETSTLTGKEAEYVRLFREREDALGSVASLEGVLNSAIEDHISGIYDWSGNNKGLVQQWLAKRFGGAGMSPASRFAKQRVYDTFEEAEAAGLKPLTTNPRILLGMYSNSIGRATNNAIFLRGLRDLRVPGSNLPLVLPSEKAPAGYVSIANRNLAGLRVHPDIAGQLRLLYDESNPNVAFKIMYGVSDTVKRIAVTTSLFHAKALIDAYIGAKKFNPKALPAAAIGAAIGTATLGPIGGAFGAAIGYTAKDLAGFLRGTDEYLQELRKGESSRVVQLAAKGGLKYSLEGEDPAVEDTGKSFYSGLAVAQQALDKAVPGAGRLTVGQLARLNHASDTFLWSRLHAGMKLNVFMEKFTELQRSAAKRGVGMSEEQAAQLAASFTNDLFGGLNWRRVAMDATTKFGREMGEATLTPGGRRVMQLLMFAPDWTISTTRAMVQAFGKGSGLRGLVDPATLADLHRQYLIRSAVYYLIVGDAVNYAMSGHHIWENKDPTMIDLDSQGFQHMQWSKHTMEPIHWMTKPGQQALNKLGFIPRESAEQVLGVDYLSTKRMPPMKSRISHLIRNVEPISVQQGKQDIRGGVSGFFGAPIYGQTPEAAREAKAQRERDRRHKPRKHKERSE